MLNEAKKRKKFRSRNFWLEKLLTQTNSTSLKINISWLIYSYVQIAGFKSRKVFRNVWEATCVDSST